MIDRENNPSPEEILAFVDEWVGNYSERGTVTMLDKAILRDMLNEIGANIEISDEARKSLSRESYSNALSAVGMREVWGENYDGYKEWANVWIENYEEVMNRKLPELGGKYAGKGKKISAMLQFFADLTSYALLEDEYFDFSDFKIRQNARFYNGRGRLEGFGKKRDRFHIIVPGYNTTTDEKGNKKEMPFAPAGFPPEFPKDAWDYIKSTKKSE